MIHSARPAPPGSLVELRRGDHVIFATVKWSDGARVGLRSDDRVPVDEILSLGNAKALQLVASEGSLIDRRKKPRHDHILARLVGRTLEFSAAIAFAAVLAAGAWGMTQEAFAKPLATIRSALSD